MRETTHARAARAAAVSRALRKRGINVLRPGGVLVEGSILGATRVTVDLDIPRARDELTQRVTEALQAAGYTVTADTETPWLLTVKKG